MKKFFLSMCFSFGMISGVFADADTVKTLNAEVKNILAPFQNKLTSSTFKFREASLDAQHVQKIAFNARYSKRGLKDKLRIKIDNLNYDYGTGLSPVTTFKGSFSMDLLRIFSLEEWSLEIARADEILTQTLASTFQINEDFIKSVVTSRTMDSHGNYTGFTALVQVNVDLDKLPEDMSRDEVLVTTAVLSIGLDLEKGKITLDAFVLSNPEYYLFLETNVGLKEMLENILNHDEDELVFINAGLEAFDGFADWLVGNDSLSRDVGKQFLSFMTRGN